MDTPQQNAADDWYSWPDAAHHCNFQQNAPVAPINVNVSVGGTGHLHISWTDTNGGQADYVVGNGNTASPDLDLSTTSYDWRNLAPGTYMCFTVAAKANRLQSPWTPWVCATTSALSVPSPSATAYGTSTWTGLSPNTKMCATVAATQSGSTTAASAQVCAETTNYVNIGDSLSSGEGLVSPVGYAELFRPVRVAVFGLEAGHQRCLLRRD